MPMRYANPDDVYELLRVDPDNPDNAETVARLDRIENGLCENFDTLIGTSFGATPTAEVRNVFESGSYANYGTMWYPESLWFDYPWTLYPSERDNCEMIVQTRIRSLVAIRYGGDWDGTTWVDDEPVPIANYILSHEDDGGYWGITNLTGSWSSGVYRIEAIWSDQVSLAVPVDVREALTFLTVDQYNMLNASPEGVIGPDGRTIRPRNPWGFTSVVQAIENHKVVELIV